MLKLNLTWELGKLTLIFAVFFSPIPVLCVHVVEISVFLASNAAFVQGHSTEIAPDTVL
jgi:hypothetical protein